MSTGYASIPNWMLRSDAFSQHMILVYIVLSSHVNHADSDPECWPSQATIAKTAGISESSVKRALTALINEQRVVTVRVVATPRGRKNFYTLHSNPTKGSGQDDLILKGGSGQGDLMGQVRETQEEEPVEQEPVTTNPSGGLQVVTGGNRVAADLPPSRPVPLPRGWKPSDKAMESFEKRFGRDVEVDLSLARFVAYYVEHPEKQSRDWTAKLAQWLAKDAADVRERRPDPNGPDENGIPKWLHKRMDQKQEQPTDPRLEAIMAEMDRNRRQA